jgi:hypothetical protein
VPRPKAILFDLGNTLVRYYTMAEFPTILAKSLASAASVLGRNGLLDVTEKDWTERATPEGIEASDHKVRPLETRLARIFGLTTRIEGPLRDDLNRAFLDPIFSTADLCSDAVPALMALREEAEAALAEFARYYNYHGLHGELGWCTPAERYDGTPFTDRGFDNVPALAHLVAGQAPEGGLTECQRPPGISPSARRPRRSPEGRRRHRPVRAERRSVHRSRASTGPGRSAHR